ncbi:MAG: divergent polysaccharide deacetylase family protein [Spirochaetaceae bacterium]|nr:divergent polysaccharide deacetylase family protein [Spirochaetaceae bacterium]
MRDDVDCSWKIDLRRKRQDITVREKFAAVFISALFIALFLAAFFAYEKIMKTGESPEAAVSSVPETAGRAEPDNAPVNRPDSNTLNKPEGNSRNKPAPQAAAKAPELKTARPVPQKARAAALPEERPLPKPQPKWKVVYVIDDAGNNLRELEPFLRFPGKITISVLPGLPNSAEAARMVREAGKELFLHQPMEAVGGADPGPGAIYKGMSAEEVRAVLEKNVREIGPIAGMNNHQGSLITQDEEIMRTVIEFCRENKLYFLDSRTTGETVAPKVSRDLGMAIAERNIFLDNEHDAGAIKSSMEQGLNMAREKETAVMIGHAWSPELAGIISSGYDDLTAQGYDFLTVSEIIQGKTKP